MKYILINYILYIRYTLCINIKYIGYMVCVYNSYVPVHTNLIYYV